MLDFGSVGELPSVGAASDGGLGLDKQESSARPDSWFQHQHGRNTSCMLCGVGKRTTWSQSPAGGGRGGHSLDNWESSFCSSNMPTMSKQQLHKAGTEVPSKGTGNFGTRRRWVAWWRWVPTLSFGEVKCGRARKVYCEGSKVRSL